MKRTILVSITGYGKSYNHPAMQPWQDKLKEIEHYGLTEVALFLELYEKQERAQIYQALANSHIKRIPLVHIRHDMTKDELAYLKKTYKTKYFTCHEINFEHNDISHWKGFFKHIYLEMNTNGLVSEKTKVEKIGGFCIDLAHFKIDLEKLNKDFAYVYQRKDMHKYFVCNHVNGWDPITNNDIHTVSSIKDFEFLKTLPEFVFGSCIAIEAFNSIKEQLAFKKYLTNLFVEKFKT